MRPTHLLLVLLLGGCSQVEIPTEPPPAIAPDVSVRTDATDSLATSAVNAYVAQIGRAHV